MNDHFAEGFQQLFTQVGEWVHDDNTGRGVITVAATATAVVLGLYRFMRRKKALTAVAADDRVRINVDAPKGQAVRIELKDDVSDDV